MEDTNSNARDLQKTNIIVIYKRGKFDHLFEEISDPVFLHDFDGNILKVNKKASECLGYSYEELETKNITHIATADFFKEYANWVEKLIKQGLIRYETTYLTKDKKLDIEVVSKVIVIDNENFILSSTRDISLRKDYEKQLIEARISSKDNEDELNAIFNKTPSMLILFDENAGILRVNKKAISTFKLEDKKIENLRMGNLINCINTNQGSSPCGMNESCKKCKLTTIIYQTINFLEEFTKKEINILLHQDDIVVEKTILLSTSVLKRNGRSVFLATIDDISTRKQIENELIIAKEKAEESDRLKTAFMNNISHEIRTPLNAILGFAPFIIEPDIEQEDKEQFLNLLYKSGERLLNTVNDYMDIAMLVSDNIKIFPKKVDIALLLNEIYTHFHANLIPDNLKFKLDLPEHVDQFTLNTDKELVKKIVSHLVDNAIKFTNTGSVQLGYILKTESEKPEIEIYIKDTGKGISCQAQSRIFKAFMQEDIANTRGHEGSGLGLSIAKGLTQLLGGEIRMKSKKNIGTTVFVTLPIEKDIHNAETIAEQPISGVAKFGTILIAEDDEQNVFYLEAILTGQIEKLLLAKNGQEAVDLCHNYPEIDLVFMDIKMPIINGIEAARLIKSFRKDLPIIALTAFAQSGDEQRFIEAGCDDYISKPFKKNEILAFIEKYLKSE